MRVEILWQEKPRVRQRNHRCRTKREITLYALFNWQIPFFESVYCRQQHQFVACNIFCETDVFWHTFFSAVCIERNTADVCVRISVYKRNCEKTFWPSQTVMNSGGKSEKMLMKYEMATDKGGTTACSWSTSGEFIWSASFWGVLRSGLGVQDSGSCVQETVRFTKRRACGKVKRKRMNHIAGTRYVGRVFIVARYISQPLLRKVWNTTSQSRNQHRMEQTKSNFQL